MRAEQIEAWVLSIVDQVAAGRRIEDSRVELKANWPEPKVAARRIAGHANAAGSNHILWIIGLDEKNGITQTTPTDLASWLPQVIAEFDELAPSLNDLVVPTPSGALVALLFDVSRRPYVVKNPVFGQQGGGPVSFEVPWRRGTKVGSARRDELVRLLVPRQALPKVELLEAFAEVGIHGPQSAASGRIWHDSQLAEHLAWGFHLKLYVTPQTTDLLVLPTHKVELIFSLGSEEPLQAMEFRFFAPNRSVGPAGSDPDTSTVTASVGEVVFRGPGLVLAGGHYYERVRRLASAVNLAVKLAVSPAGSDLKEEIGIQLPPSGEQEDHKGRWGNQW